MLPGRIHHLTRAARAGTPVRFRYRPQIKILPELHRRANPNRKAVLLPRARSFSSKLSFLRRIVPAPLIHHRIAFAADLAQPTVSRVTDGLFDIPIQMPDATPIVLIRWGMPSRPGWRLFAQ